MKNLILSSAQEIVQHPKTALAVTSMVTFNGFLQWFGSNISLISGVVGLIGAVTVTVIQIKRNSREAEEHKLKMAVLEKQVNP